MRRLVWCFAAIICIGVFAGSAVFAQTRTSNSIQGYVFDSVTRRPVADVYVELLDDTYSRLKRIQTDGSGRFYFGGLSQGRFKVKVLPYRYNYAEETQDAELMNFTSGNAYTADSVYLDFYLKVDKRRAPVDALGAVGSVFVQEIPPAAKSLYEKGVASFGKPTESDLGFQSITKALEIFPDYYDALTRISYEYIKRDLYLESVPHLIRAVKVNQRSFSCHYMLGTAAYSLKQYKEAAEAFRLALVINPQSALTFVKYGMVLRIAGDMKTSETALLKAVSISKEEPLPDAHWQLALLYDKLQRYAEAVQQLEKYLTLRPDVENKAQIRTLINSMKANADKKKTS